MLVEVHVSIQKQCYINHVASQQLCPDRMATVIMYTVILCLCVYIQLFAQRVYIYFAHRVCMYIYKHCYMYVPICSIYTYFVLFYIYIILIYLYPFLVFYVYMYQHMNMHMNM